MDKLVIWPQNIEAERSRKNGRKVSKKDSVSAPALKEIEIAARKLGLNPIAEKDKAYPKEWWGVKGRVLVDKKKPKSILIREVARKVKELRGDGK